MQEELISFETAKLAKEKGFDGSVSSLFDKEGNELSIHYWDYSSMTDKLEATFEDLEDGEYLRPTQSLLQRWLREVHNIFIIVKPMITEYEQDLADEWEVVVYLNVSGAKGNYIKILECKTYEEALELGLQKALKLIKNE